MINPDITLAALKLTCELQIDEYKAYQREKTLDRYYELIQKIENILLRKGEKPIDILFYKARIASIRGNFEEAFDLLTEMQELSKQHSLGLVTIKAGLEIIKLEEEINRFRNKYFSNKDFIDKILQDEIDRKSEYTRQTEIEVNLNIENPILLLVIQEGGLLKLSYSFRPTIPINSNLISSFLVAITSFAQEAFGVEGALDRIMYQKFTILIKTRQKIQYCYIFEGIETSASAKLADFEAYVENDPILNKHIMESQSFKDLVLKESTLSAINQIFEKS